MFTLRQLADLQLPTRWANFRMLAFEGLDEEKRPGKPPETALALLLGELHHAPPVVRIHSQCATGDIFHSLRCDCHDQLHLALRTIANEGSGILLYEHQEGRGIGLMEKLRAYELQDQGLDTIEANLRLGHPVDARDYQLPVAILHAMNIPAIRLMTNNPDKMNAVRSSGIELVGRVSADVPSSPYSAAYLSVKRDQLGHLSESALQSKNALL